MNVRELAALAGVSKTTVSRALRHEPGMREDVRARILSLAEQFHYRSNRPAQAPLIGNMSTVGFVTMRLTIDYVARMLRGIIQQAEQASMMVIAHEIPVDAPEAYLASTLRMMVEQGVRGIVIYHGHHRVSAASVLDMWSHDVVPVLISATQSDRPLDHIYSDEDQLARLAVDYLVSLGHERIGYYGTPWEHGRNQAILKTLQTRRLTTRYSVCAHGVALPTHSIEQALDFWLSMSPPPTAIFTIDDYSAIQLLTHALRRGIKIPEDLSIIGCSNFDIGQYLLPRLTTIEQYPEKYGQQAFSLIQRRLDEGLPPSERVPKTVRITPRLIVRESCGAPR